MGWHGATPSVYKVTPLLKNIKWLAVATVWYDGLNKIVCLQNYFIFTEMASW